jgi:hypothetical protein
MKRIRVCGLAVVLAVATGCGGGPSIVPVSGVVKLDGQPCKNVVVSFQPVGSKETPNPGRGSAAVTDENGRFTLVYDGERPGALVGRHRVRIFPKSGADTEGTVLGRNTKIEKPLFIPAEWNETSTKEYDVPTDGTEQANFDIESNATRPRHAK